MPYIFLAVLIAILLFILGIRYGQHVEKINKTVEYVISIPPSPTSAPTSIPLAFSNYSHLGCQISFLLPNELEKTKESSSSALFSTREKKLGIALLCEKKTYSKTDTERIATINKTIRVYEVQTKDTTSYRMYHPITGKVVTLTVAQQYLPLIEKSLELSSK